MIGAQRVDFIAVPTRDRERAVRFYGETLGLVRNPNSSDTWVEFETGNVTLAIVVPEEIGKDFAPLPFGSLPRPGFGSVRPALLSTSRGVTTRNSLVTGACLRTNC